MTLRKIKANIASIPPISGLKKAVIPPIKSKIKPTVISTKLTGTTYSDANGHGTFKYSPNQGGAANFDGAAKNFYAMNTKNLKEFGG